MNTHTRLRKCGKDIVQTKSVEDVRFFACQFPRIPLENDEYWCFQLRSHSVGNTMDFEKLWDSICIIVHVTFDFSNIFALVHFISFLIELSLYSSVFFSCSWCAPETSRCREWSPNIPSGSTRALKHLIFGFCMNYVSMGTPSRTVTDTANFVVILRMLWKTPTMRLKSFASNFSSKFLHSIFTQPFKIIRERRNRNNCHLRGDIPKTNELRRFLRQFWNDCKTRLSQCFPAALLEIVWANFVTVCSYPISI